LGTKAIIFDLDGTLVDTAADLSGAMNYALKKFGRPTHPVEVCKQMIGDGLKMFAKRALGKDSQHLQDEVIGAMKARYRDKCFEFSVLYDGISETISKLRQRQIRLAILTNKDQDDARYIVEHFFGANTFEYVIGVAGAIGVKPDICETMKIVELMGLGCDDFLLIGDGVQDIRTGAAAGIRTVGASWGFRGREELVKAGAEVIIDRPVEILGLVA